MNRIAFPTQLMSIEWGITEAACIIITDNVAEINLVALFTKKGVTDFKMALGHFCEEMEEFNEVK